MKSFLSVYQNPFAKKACRSYLLFGLICLIAVTLFQYNSYRKQLQNAEQFISDQIGLLSLSKTSSNDLTEQNNLYRYYAEGEIDSAIAVNGKALMNNLGIKPTYPLIQHTFQSNLKLGLSLAAGIWFVGLIFLTIALHRFFQQLDNLQLYIKNSSAGAQEYEMTEVNEGVISSIKNQLYDFTEELSTEKERATLAKKELANGMADISHQLKTPLTSLYILADLLESPLTEQQQRDTIQQLIPQLDRMQTLITNLLTLTKLDAGTLDLQQEKIDLSSLLQECLAYLAILSGQKELVLDLQLEDQLSLFGDYKLLKEACLNLIKNAIQHSPVGGIITIQTASNPLYTSLIVKDEGSGIATADLPHLFQRFYKGSNALPESIGIGLAMAHTIIEKQQGTIEVRNNKNQGACFEVKMYKGII